MHIEWYTLPVMTLLFFAGVLGFRVADDATVRTIADRMPRGERVAFFPDPFRGAASASLREREGVVGLWSFDEGEGVTVYDKSGGAHTGVLKGNPRWLNDGEPIRLSFDGLDDYVEIEGSDVLSLNDRFTLTAWIKPKGDAFSVIVSKSNAEGESEGGYMMGIDKHRFLYGVHNRAAAAVGFLEQSDKWVYVTAVYDQNREPNTKLYVNGVHSLSSDMQAPEANDSTLLIGRDALGNYFRGEMGTIRIYNRALGDLEVQGLYEEHRRGEPIGAIVDSKAGWWERVIRRLEALLE